MLFFCATILISYKRENNPTIYNYCIKALQNAGHKVTPEEEALKIYDSKTNRYLLFYYIPQEKK